MNITCIGSGAFSVAIASLLSENENNHIIIWSHDKSWVSKCIKKKQLLLSNANNIALPSNIILTNSYDEALNNADIIFILTNSKYILDVVNELKYYSFRNKTAFIGTKGMLGFKPYSLSSYVKKALKVNKIGYFAGPNFACDLINKSPAIITLASKKKKLYSLFKKLFPQVRIEFTSDIEVLELGSVLKNIYAIGAGICYGYNSATSSMVSYASLAYVEMCHLISQLTSCYFVHEVKGILGDFFLTNMNQNSRNFSYGIERSKSSNQASNYLKSNTVEGYENLENIVNYLGASIKFYPILYTIYDIIYKNKKTDSLLDICFKRD